MRKLRKARQVGLLVFCDAHGRPHGYHWWGDSFKTAMDKAGFTKQVKAERHLVPHSLRATANTILLDLGVNSIKVRAAMGWAQEDVQRGYTDTTLFDLDEMSAKMESAVK